MNENLAGLDLYCRDFLEFESDHFRFRTPGARPQGREQSDVESFAAAQEYPTLPAESTSPEKNQIPPYEEPGSNHCGVRKTRGPRREHEHKNSEVPGEAMKSGYGPPDEQIMARLEASSYFR